MAKIPLISPMWGARRRRCPWAIDRSLTGTNCENRLTTYKYHHGYYDGREREFRGFGRVDRYDTEEFETFANASLHDEEHSFGWRVKAQQGVTELASLADLVR